MTEQCPHVVGHHYSVRLTPAGWEGHCECGRVARVVFNPTKEGALDAIKQHIEDDG